MVQKLSKIGALPSQLIREMTEAGFITGAEQKNIRPSSLDLSISDEVYEVEGIFQPRPGESIRDLLKLIQKKKHSLESPLLKGKMYLARLSESLKLPKHVYGYCNPKSTSGRLDTHVRVLADGVPRYDAVTPEGFSGELWIVILPNSFSVKMLPGQTLSQVRFFTGDTRFDELRFEIAMERYRLLWRKKREIPLAYDELKIRDNDGSAILTLGLTDEVLGYRCRVKDPDMVLDLSKIGYYRPEDFFEPFQCEDGYLSLKRGEFYILSTNEAVRVPPELACEMVPMDERSGDFRSHYAGFIDPGWGFGKEGEGKGKPLTLEVRPFEDLIVRHQQPIAKIRFEHMIEIPDMSYDALDSNYLKQDGPKLAKQFLSPEN
ncbi:MAG TPA: 2'-deoxycytidine 5'-triphosphate deaminase [Candidatus Paceibacterota bacterium]|nr:2'-deoxycytidine 5'-triphosphate deaminase [Candidatus Paceibacterota bacterium]